MATEPPTKRISSELARLLGVLNDDLDRLEVLTGALAGLNRPIPEYEPWFHHLRGSMLCQHELAVAGNKRAD